MEPYTWTCPYCNQIATITGQNVSSGSFEFDDHNKHGAQVLRLNTVTCPNGKCREYALEAELYKLGKDLSGRVVRLSPSIRKWRLRPDSFAKPFPDYIPRPILDDYQEACLIRDLSPKASATLSRRCLQGVIRDFWGIADQTLKKEIELLKGKIDDNTWKAIDAVRSVGNIGAHMEKDINVVVDVDPGEAELLIGLIETLLKEWYISRKERNDRLDAIVTLAQAKKDAKNPPKPEAQSPS